jgi:hypothetical protein
MSEEIQNLAIDYYLGLLDMEHHGGPSTIINYYKMIGIASGNPVAWVVTGSPDFAGVSYSGPGVLDLATISVSDSWT